MKIKSLRLEHFRRFNDFKIDFDTQLTVLVAKNGAGKSSVLDGVAIALGQFLTRLPKVSGLNPKDSDFQIHPDQSRPPYMRISCVSHNEIEWDRTEKRDKSVKTAKAIPEAKGIKKLIDYVDQFINKLNENSGFELPVFIYYGTGRGVFDLPQRKSNLKNRYERFDAFSGALESRTNFKRFLEYFYNLEVRELRAQKENQSFDYQLPELKAIRLALNKMLPEFSRPRVAKPVGIEVDWDQGGAKKKLRIEQLSDGYRTTLAMVMDIASRMAEANPDMKDPLQSEGVVLIDEVDLHLHPGWQQTILLDLIRTFPNIQFIVSTHSPQVISSVKPSALRVIDWQDEEPILKDVKFSEGAETQQMLLDVLGLQSTRVEELSIVKKLNEYKDLVSVNKWDCDKAKILRRELDDWGQFYEPELKRIDIDIRIKEWDLSR